MSRLQTLENNTMTSLTLSIGSNCDAARNLRLAYQALLAEFGNIDCSAVYESEPVGFEGDNFLNLVAVIETEQPLTRIAATLKQIEDDLGRDRSQPKFSGRTMDIDVLTFGDASGSDCGMHLPRAEITRNAFVLRPLAELLPEQVHGPTGKCFAELWQEFDKTRQKLWPVPFDWQAS